MYQWDNNKREIKNKKVLIKSDQTIKDVHADFTVLLRFLPISQLILYELKHEKTALVASAKYQNLPVQLSPLTTLTLVF